MKIIRLLRRLVSLIKSSQDLKKALVVLYKGYPTASTSLFQRELRIPYGRAVRLMDILGQKGVLGSWVSSKSRRVLINNPKFLDYFCPSCKLSKVDNNNKICANCDISLNEIEKKS